MVLVKDSALAINRWIVLARLLKLRIDDRRGCLVCLERALRLKVQHFDIEHHMNDKQLLGCGGACQSADGRSGLLFFAGVKSK